MNGDQCIYYLGDGRCRDGRNCAFAGRKGNERFCTIEGKCGPINSGKKKSFIVKSNHKEFL